MLRSLARAYYELTDANAGSAGALACHERASAKQKVRSTPDQISLECSGSRNTPPQTQRAQRLSN